MDHFDKYMWTFWSKATYKSYGCGPINPQINPNIKKKQTQGQE